MTEEQAGHYGDGTTVNNPADICEGRTEWPEDTVAEEENPSLEKMSENMVAACSMWCLTKPDVKPATMVAMVQKALRNSASATVHGLPDDALGSCLGRYLPRPGNMRAYYLFLRVEPGVCHDASTLQRELEACLPRVPCYPDTDFGVTMVHYGLSPGRFEKAVDGRFSYVWPLDDDLLPGRVWFDTDAEIVTAGRVQEVEERKQQVWQRLLAENDRLYRRRVGEGSGQ
jgi:hypothetical protein